MALFDRYDATFDGVGMWPLCNILRVRLQRLIQMITPEEKPPHQREDQLPMQMQILEPIEL